MMRRSLARLALLPLLLLLAVACETVPFTGRRQLVLLSAQQELELGQQAFQQTLAKAKISQDPELRARVERVGWRIAKAAAAADARGLTRDYQWEFAVIDDPKTANAFALPGGKVAVYTGILKFMPTDNHLAVVLAHEVAHVIARHGNERVSRGQLTQLAGSMLSIGMQNEDPKVVEQVLGLYGLGTEFGVHRPFGRGQELEADEIGIRLMQGAAYDARAAIDFWQRMSAASGAGAPEFLSTHPSPERRIARIRELLGEG